MTVTDLRRRPVWLPGLILAAFVVQVDDYMVLGIMQPMSSALGTGEAALGMLVTVYSLVYAVGAPVMALWLGRVSQRGTVAVALVVFALANLAVLWVSSFAGLILVRVLAALAAAVILPGALAIAAQRSAPETRGRAMALVMAGLTGAIVVGVPGAALVADALGWRATFAACGVLALVLAVWVGRTVPRLPVPPGRLPGGIRILADRPVATLFAVTTTAVAGNLAFQTYLAPFLIPLTGIGQQGFALFLLVIGLAGLLGTYLAGLLADRTSPRSTLILVLALFAGSAAALALLAQVGSVHPVLAGAVLVAWSASAWGVPPAIQTLLIARVGTARATQALAFNSSAVYLGAAIGSAAGGVLIGAQAGATPLAACVAGVVAIAVVIYSRRSDDGANRAHIDDVPMSSGTYPSGEDGMD